MPDTNPREVRSRPRSRPPSDSPACIVKTNKKRRERRAERMQVRSSNTKRDREKDSGIRPPNTAKERGGERERDSNARGSATDNRDRSPETGTNVFHRKHNIKRQPLSLSLSLSLCLSLSPGLPYPISNAPRQQAMLLPYVFCFASAMMISPRVLLRSRTAASRISAEAEGPWGLPPGDFGCGGDTVTPYYNARGAPFQALGTRGSPRR